MCMPVHTGPRKWVSNGRKRSVINTLQYKNTLTRRTRQNYTRRLEFKWVISRKSGHAKQDNRNFCPLKSGNDLNNTYELVSYTTQRTQNIRCKVDSATVLSEERPLFILWHNDSLCGTPGVCFTFKPFKPGATVNYRAKHNTLYIYHITVRLLKWAVRGRTAYYITNRCVRLPFIFMYNDPFQRDKAIVWNEPTIPVNTKFRGSQRARREFSVHVCRSIMITLGQ